MQIFGQSVFFFYPPSRSFDLTNISKSQCRAQCQSDSIMQIFGQSILLVAEVMMFVQECDDTDLSSPPPPPRHQQSSATSQFASNSVSLNINKSKTDQFQDGLLGVKVDLCGRKACEEKHHKGFRSAIKGLLEKTSRAISQRF